MLPVAKVCADPTKDVTAVVNIAQVAPLFESVPPRYHDGTERVVSESTPCTFPSRAASSSLTLRRPVAASIFPDSVPPEKEFREAPVTSVAYAPREPLLRINWQGPVYHGLPDDMYRFRPAPGKYLPFLGHISPEIAKRISIQIKIASKVDALGSAIRRGRRGPPRQDPLVEDKGVVGGGEKDEFLGNAYALRFPLDWLEPFGSVMIEAQPKLIDAA